MEEYIKALQHLIGNGCPNTAQIYFFGLEEKGDIKNDEPERIKFYKDEYSKLQNKDSFWTCIINKLYEKEPKIYENDKRNSNIQTYAAYCNIYNSIFNKSFTTDEFFENSIKENSDVFIGNINWIPRPNNSLLTKSELKSFKEKRLPLVIKFIDKYVKDYEEKIFIIFGNYRRKEKMEIMNPWKEVEKSPSNQGSTRTISLAQNQNKHYTNLYWTYHPAHGWLTEEHQKHYAETIKNNRG